MILTNMQNCLPGTVLSNVRKKSIWYVRDYELDNGVKGRCISAGPETNAPNVTLPLQSDGWHAVYVGLGGSNITHNQPIMRCPGASLVKLKLTGDPCFTPILREKPAWNTVEEAFWKYADLTGRRRTGSTLPFPNDT